MSFGIATPAACASGSANARTLPPFRGSDERDRSAQAPGTDLDLAPNQNDASLGTDWTAMCSLRARCITRSKNASVSGSTILITASW